MDRFILEAPVNIHGRDFFGRKAFVRLEPVDAMGWFWNIGGTDIPFDAHLLASKKNRIVLSHEKHSLHVFEHLGALRFSGLDGIRIIAGSDWLPYDGSALLFWKACAPRMRQEGVLRPFSACEPASAAHGTAGNERSVSYDSAPFDCLVVDVFVDYPGVGPHRQKWRFPHHPFGQIARAKTQGWPPSRRTLARLAAVLGWPHRHNVVWPQEHRSFLVRRLFARHRALDVLGAFSVLCPPGGFLAGTIRSKRAGHAQDIELVQKARIRPVEISEKTLHSVAV